MKRVFWLVVLLAGLSLILISCGSNAFKSLSDENSDDACRYKTTQNLDSGNYDAVLTSTCANSMQLGAAYFGNAGYDIKDVINNLSKAQDKTDPLTLYMSSLTGIITDDTLDNLDNAEGEYCKVVGEKVVDGTKYCIGFTALPNYTEENRKDSNFYISLVDSVKSLSLLKLIIDNNGDGALSKCDINGDSVPDDADAAACALIASANISESAGLSCSSGATYIQTPTDITIQKKNGIGNFKGTYRGLTVTITGASTEECLSPATYKKLLYRDFSSGKYWVATTTSEIETELCQESSPNPSRRWPCPIEQKDTTPLDLVNAIDTSITNAINSLGNALPGVTGIDVQEAIQDIRNDACCSTGEAQPCTCTSSEIANYLQKIKK